MTRKVIPIEVENTICPQRWDFPYINMGKQEIKMCCLASSYKITESDIEKYGSECFTNNDYTKERRLEMLQGIRHPDCSFCWEIEDKGIPSPRQLHHTYIPKYKETLDYLLDNWSEDIDINSDLLISKIPYMLELVIDTTCDLKCVYCSPRYSSKWASESLKHNIISIEDYNLLTAEPTDSFKKLMLEWLSSSGSNLEMLRVSGGEPLIASEFYNIMNYLLSIDSNTGHKMTVSIVTNLNAKEKQFNEFISMIPRILNKFNLEIIISMESVEEQAEYIRTGLDWNRFNSNVNKLCEINSTNDNMHIALNPTLNVLSIPGLKYFIQWFIDLEMEYDKKLSIKNHMVKSPKCHSVYVLPGEFGKYIDEAIYVMNQGRFNHSAYTDFLTSIKNHLENNMPDENLQREFREWFSKNDTIRNLSLIETFPELKEFYENRTK